MGMVTIAVLLLVAWLLGWLVFEAAGFLIHLLLIVGAIMLVVALVKRARGGVSSVS